MNHHNRNADLLVALEKQQIAEMSKIRSQELRNQILLGAQHSATLLLGGYAPGEWEKQEVLDRCARASLAQLAACEAELNRLAEAQKAKAAETKADPPRVVT